MTGIVIRIFPDKNFGFIRVEDERREYFFHLSDFQGFFEDLVTDVMNGRKIEVEFEAEVASKGPRARQVFRTDNGV